MNLKNKIIIITGATSGIGKSAAITLAAAGATLGLVVRDAARGRKLVDHLTATTGNGQIQYFLCNMEMMEEVRKLASELRSAYPVIDVLINNAGAINDRRVMTPEGYELTFAANHLGPFLLTNLLLNNLRASSDARIINLASEAQKIGNIYFDDLQLGKGYSSMKAYCQSKLANIMFTYELSHRLNGDGIKVNAMHPGVVNTRFGADLKGITKWMFSLAKPFLRSPEKGAETVIWLATSDTLNTTTGKYFHDNKEIKSIPLSYDRMALTRLWEVSEELTGLGRS